MSQNINQFGQVPDQGDADLQPGFVVSAKISASDAVALVAGQAVKMADVAGGIPVVTALTANTDQTFGFLARNLKDSSYAADARCEVAIVGTVLWMTAGAAIARGALLEVVYTTNKVITSAGVNPQIGMALDKASADTDLIRVLILTPNLTATGAATLAGAVLTAEVTATLAEINAGKTIIPAVVGKGIKVVNYAERVTGNFAATTSVDIQSGTTAVKVAVAAVAALTTGAVLVPGSANTTLGAGFATALPTGESLVVANVGSAATTGTSIKYTVSYVLV